MVMSRSVKIANPYLFANLGLDTQIKEGLMKQGFGFKKNYKETKLIAVTKYWWPSAKQHIYYAGGSTTITFPAGQFYVYTYTYPEYKVNKSVVTSYENVENLFYDDSIEETLGGERRMLGV